MTEMCDLCPRTPVTHVPSLYSFKLGHPAGGKMNDIGELVRDGCCFDIRGTSGLAVVRDLSTLRKKSCSSRSRSPCPTSPKSCRKLNPVIR